MLTAGAVSAATVTVAVSEPATVTTIVLVLVDLDFAEETTEATDTNEGTNAGVAVSMIGATVMVLFT